MNDEVGQEPRWFRYRAQHRQSGKTVSGEQAGNDAYEVRAALRRTGLDVLHLEELRSGAWSGWSAGLQAAWWARRRRQRRLARADCFDALATMCRAGLPLEQALGNLAHTPARAASERAMLQRLRERVRQGQALSQACELEPGWFDALDVAMLRAGQSAGDLPATLTALAVGHQRSGELSHRLIGALAYPCLLALGALAVTVFLGTTTLPKLTAMLSDAGQEVPLLTQAVMGFGGLIANWWPLILVALVALVLLTRRLSTHLDPQRGLGRHLLANPMTRALQRARIADLAAVLARLQRSGLPLADALQAVIAAGPSRSLRALLERSVSAIKRGERLSEVIGDSALLDPEFAHLIALGETSGDLADMLDRIAERYRRSAERSIDRLTALLEPVSILFLAGLVFLIALAAILPIIRMGDIA